MNKIVKAYELLYETKDFDKIRLDDELLFGNKILGIVIRKGKTWLHKHDYLIVEQFQKRFVVKCFGDSKYTYVKNTVKLYKHQYPQLSVVIWKNLG